MNYIHFDSETFLFGDGNYAPKIVCAQFAWNDDPAVIFSRDKAKPVFEELLRESDLIWVSAKSAYDFACAMATWPEFTTQIFELFEQRRVIDIVIYEKFVMLGKNGYIASRTLPNGKSEKLSYSVSAIAYRRLGITMKGKEKDDESIWRLNFDSLDSLDASEYPEEAREYALDDVRVLPLILKSQIEEGISFSAAPISAAADFGLYLMKCQGVDIDPVARKKVEDWVASELTDERLEPLYQSGILRRPEPARPHANQMKRVKAELPSADFERATKEGWDSYREFLAGAGIKLTEPKPASVDTKVLRAILAEVANKNNITIRMTDGGKDGLNPQISTGDEFLQEVEHLDPRLAAFAHRQRLGKIITTELPRIQAPRVYPNYDALKETGRTSSWDPNIQNVDPRVRNCYVPPPGWVFISVDYAAIELVTLAQKLIWLFGSSTLANLINNGVDPHAYLGARLSYELDNARYMKYSSTDPMELYRAFLELKKGSEEEQEYFTHWRTLAKPTGLGYPGGLGPDTFITYAKGTYGVTVTLEQAHQLREIWHATFPEMRDYFNWINEDCATPEGDYAYVSPAGMLRNHCTYCACANGAALQTPAAEGAKLAIWEVVRKCFDPSKRSILYGCKPWGFIHDQIIVSSPLDGYEHERASEIQSDMVSSMKQVIPDVAVRTEACLMLRWDKGAKPKYDAARRLIPWDSN